MLILAPQIRVAFTTHQRRLFLQQVETSIESHNCTKYIITHDSEVSNPNGYTCNTALTCKAQGKIEVKRAERLFRAKGPGNWLFMAPGHDRKKCTHDPQWHGYLNKTSTMSWHANVNRGNYTRSHSYTKSYRWSITTERWKEEFIHLLFNPKGSVLDTYIWTKAQQTW